MHDLSGPHGVPDCLPSPLMHTGEPVSQEITPFLHTSLTVHSSPPLQVTHSPFLHTRSTPQAVPFWRALPVSSQTGLPVEQESTPVWHLFCGVHAEPSAHGTHSPSLHTLFSPQTLPSGA